MNNNDAKFIDKILVEAVSWAQVVVIPGILLRWRLISAPSGEPTLDLLALPYLVYLVAGLIVMSGLDLRRHKAWAWWATIVISLSVLVWAGINIIRPEPFLILLGLWQAFVLAFLIVKRSLWWQRQVVGEHE